MNISRRYTILIFAGILLSGFSFGLFIFLFESDNPSTRVSDTISFFSPPDSTNNKKTQDSLYRVFVRNGENFSLQKDLNQAIISFEKALKIKPFDTKLKERIAGLKTQLAEQNHKNNEYLKALTSGDAYFNAKDYLNAKGSYQVAIDNRPDDTLAKEKLRKTMDLLRSQKAQNILYDVAMASADKLFQAKDYERARQEYENASKILPQEQYPREKINEIIKIQIDKQVNDELYAKAISNGDKFYLNKSYQSALLEFQKALGIKSEEHYPKQKIAELTTLIAAQKIRDDSYTKAILQADQLYQQTKYLESIKSYQQALTIKPDEVYPKNRIREIESLLTSKQRDQMEYDHYITLADSLYIGKSYLRARENYAMASSVKPSEAYPKEMISKADKMLTGREAAMAKTMDEQWMIIIFTADNLLKNKDFEQARAEYLKATLLKPAEKYPVEKIQEIDKFLADQRARDEQYRLTIVNADKMFGQKNYDPAKAEYQKATGFKPAEIYPRLKITEIDSILNSLALAKDREEQYKLLIISADKELTDQTYDQARTDYQKAMAIKPSEAYPKFKITEIDRILQGISRQKAADERYLSLIVSADSLLTLRAYEQAKTGYQDAMKIKPEEIYPKTKLNEIAEIMALLAKENAVNDHYSGLIVKGENQLQIKQYTFARGSFEQALNLKPEEKLPKDKIVQIDSILAELAKQKALDDQYNSIIANADKLLASRILDQARSEYVDAGNLKPDEQYPKDKIAEIDKSLGAIAAQKALDEQYAKAIADADKLFLDKTYDQARSLYVNASNLKPAETYPETKIGEIDKIFADIANQKALDDEYTAVIMDADKLLGEKTFELAKVEYQKAGGLKPAEQYPKTKIAEIDKELGDQARRKAIDDQYKSAISVADKFFGEKDYDQARTAYTNAGKIKPSEQYPKDKLAEITTILAELAKQKALDDQYKSIIARGDQLLASKSYELAKTEYINAGKLKPDELYPKDKVSEIDGILTEIKAREEAYKASVTNADQLFAEKKYDESSNEFQNALAIKPEAKYPADKIAEINRILTDLKGKRQTYDELVAKGDGQFNQKDWVKAKGLYQQALTIFPEEAYPKNKIGQIGFKIDSIYRANKVRYDQAVAEGDRFYNSFEYDKAIDSYTDAIELLPMENYPREMISKIRRTIAENAIVDVLKTTVTIAAGEEKQFSFTTVNMASRKNNFVYIKIRNLSSKVFNVLLRYGKDKQPGGGVVIRNLSADGKVNERLISVRDQDAWYRLDNNWISLYPQGGDVEVSFIQVSRALKQ